MSNEKKNLQQNPSRYFRVLTAVLFLADVVLAPWLREGNRSFMIWMFIMKQTKNKEIPAVNFNSKFTAGIIKYVAYVFDYLKFKK